MRDVGRGPAVVRVTDAYFSLKTLAGYSGLSVRRLRDCLTDRKSPLPFYRIGGKILVRRSDFDAWAARFRRDPVAISAIELNLEPARDAELFEHYVKTWLKANTRTLKASTLAFYEAHVERHLVPAFRGRPVGSLRRTDCRELVTRCRAKGLKASTVRGIARTLSPILSQAVEDELLPANPALRLGKYLRTADDMGAEIEPVTRDEVRHLVDVAAVQFPEWHPWLLCGLRIGMRAGELLALQWGDINWRGRYIQLQRNLVRGQLTTPKNHQRRRVDLSRQLAVGLRLWRRRQRAAWLKVGKPRPDWLFASVTGATLDESNVRKAFNRLLDAAELNRRGPHQMRHTFASLLLQDGAPITYVSRQLGHKDPSITLKVYSHWLPDNSTAKLVDVLDDTSPRVTQASPTTPDAEVQRAISGLERVVTLNFASWNRIRSWLRQLESIRSAA